VFFLFFEIQDPHLCSTALVIARIHDEGKTIEA